MRLRVLPFQFAFLSMAFLGSLWGQARNESPKQELKQQTVPLSPQELFKRLLPSVFIVEVLDRKDTVIAFGSGICIAPNLIVTNNHVIEDGASVRISQGSKTWPARVMAQDGDHDLCDLEVNGLEAPAVSVRPSSSLEVGERVYSIGAPEGLELTFSEGLISSFRTYKQTQVIQTTAAISHGSSGGGLFDARGQLAGITTFFIEEGQSLNFAIPGELALAISQHQKQTSASAQDSAPLARDPFLRGSADVDIKVGKPFLRKRNELVFVYVVTNNTGADIAFNCPHSVYVLKNNKPNAKIYLRFHSGVHVEGSFNPTAEITLKVEPCDLPRVLPVAVSITLYLGDVPRKLRTWQEILQNSYPDLEGILILVPLLDLRLNFPVPQR